MVGKTIKKLDYLLKTIKAIFDENNRGYLDFSILLGLIEVKCSNLSKEFIEKAIIELIKQDFFFIIEEKLKIRGYN